MDERIETLLDAAAERIKVEPVVIVEWTGGEDPPDDGGDWELRTEKISKPCCAEWALATVSWWQRPLRADERIAA